MNMRELIKDLEARRELVRKMGGDDKVKKQNERGKMTARERMAARSSTTASSSRSACTAPRWASAAGPSGDDKPPADAVVCGFGKVDGRMVCAAAYDFTVKGGSIG
jgi:acetyl-CoA carboxylase carboxyltransferase component